MSKEGVLQIPSLKGKVSDAAWPTRVDLAACYRIVDMSGLAALLSTTNPLRAHLAKKGLI